VQYLCYLDFSKGNFQIANEPTRLEKGQQIIIL
jgi:hypothetical protein